MGRVTVLDPHPELQTDAVVSGLDALVADCEEVRRHLAEVPVTRARMVPIPSRAVAMVAGLGTYGD